MKKTMMALVSLALVFALAACGNTPASSAVSTPAPASVPPAPTSEPAASDAPASETGEAGSDTLVVYFTMPEATGVDTVAGASRFAVDGEVLGSTQLVAGWIAEQTSADTFAIKTVQTYPADHDELTDFASDELAQNARPELATHIENLDDYSTIFVGYPNWWGDMPMPLYSFFDEYDFAGKTIVPFNTHGGSRFSNTISEITSMEPDAQVVQDGFTVSRNDVGGAQADVLTWLAGLGY